MAEKLTSSFRDPSGFVFKKNGEIYRQINAVYKDDYEMLMTSGLYDTLVKKNMLVQHQEIDNADMTTSGYKTIMPDKIKFISYPYEWSFSMLKDAALLTLRIQKQALKHGMTLKDASAYNIQFVDGKPIFIDTLSFEKNDTKAWGAYGQFCRHFLAPLLLAKYVDIRLFDLLKTNIDGIPLDLASKMLPIKSKLSFSTFIHIHLHSSFQAKYQSSQKSGTTKEMSVGQKLAFIEGLRNFVKSINWHPKNTEWGDYYSFTNYSDEGMENKKAIVSKFIDIAQPFSCWDMGANNGFFTRIASSRGIPSLAFDIDPIAVEKNYLQIKDSKEQNLIPLKMDLTNPSPSIGWGCTERDSIVARGRADLVMALALIHHLAITNNVPLERIAEFFNTISNKLIIEFVPKSDSKVQILLASREDIFPEYTTEGFENAFELYFDLIAKEQVIDSDRIIYYFRKRG